MLGHTFDIVEPDILAAIQARLAAMQRTGEIGRMEAALKARTVAFVHRPTPVPGIGRTVKARSWLYDPSITLKMDLRDAQGVVFHHKGERIDPLDYRPLHEHLLFIDGDVSAEVAWALKTEKRKAGLSKIILVKGPVIALQKRLRRPIYFDQGGVLVRKFGIAHVPALVEQDGRMLRVSEVVP